MGLVILATVLWVEVLAPGPQSGGGALSLRAQLPGGSVDPCVGPITWSIGDVDPRAGVSPEQLRGAVETAVSFWEIPTGRTIFAHDPAGRMSVHVVYDHRQEAMQAHLRREARLQELQAEAERLEIDYRRARSEYERGADSYSSAMAASLRQNLNALARDLNRAIERYNGQVAQWNREAPIQPSQVGTFEARVTTRGELVEGDVTVYRFRDARHLALVIAHELGHALGIDHVAERGALMHEDDGGFDVDGPLRARSADLRAFTRQCG